MKYIALFRGINVGTTRRIEMKKLKILFESMGCVQVSPYINSGNMLFESSKRPSDLRTKIETAIKKEFGLDIPTLVKTEQEMQAIVQVIPSNWQNDSTQRTDVAFLFPEIDSKKTIEELPVKRDYIDIRYVKGAIYWNVQRKNYTKSHLNKIISHELYQFMTVRNINTVRYLTGYK